MRRDVEKKLGGPPHAIKIIFLGKFTGKQAELHNDISEIGWFTPDEIYEMSHNALRDLDIKQMVKDYLAGQRFSLEIINHTVTEP